MSETTGTGPGYEDVSVERAVEVGASPEEVWEHIVDGTLASEWMGSPITIDPRVGGVVGFAPDGTEFIGTVEEIEEGRSITWSWRHPDRDPSQVTIAVEPGEAGGTVITVTERLLPYRVTDTRTRWWVEENRTAFAVRLAA